MSSLNKIFLKSSLISGLIFATLMAGFDYKEGLEFNTQKFFFRFIFFGLLMGSINWHYSKKEQNKNE